MNLVCPECGADIIEDYWDTVEEHASGGFVLDAFEALVCSKRCGYYKRIENNDTL